MKLLDKDGDGQVSQSGHPLHKSHFVILSLHHSITSSFYLFLLLLRSRRRLMFLIALQISEQEIADGLALSMKRPPSQAELAAVVR
jgi:hypothetical protein